MKRYLGVVIFMVYTVVSLAIATYTIRSQENHPSAPLEDRAQPMIETRQAVLEPEQSKPLSEKSTDEVVSSYAALSADKIIEQTNAYRATKNLQPLQKNDQLTTSACEKAQHMISKNYWAHTSPDGKTPWYFIKQAGYKYRASGENLAYGYTTNQSVVQGWIKSRGHEKILSGNYIETGVCVITDRIYRGYKTSLIVGHYAHP